MSVDHDLAALSELCGILPRYYDLQGNDRATSSGTQRALLAANGFDVSSDEAIRFELAALRHHIADRWFPEEVIVESGAAASLQFGLGASWTLHLDGSYTVIARGEPADHITLPTLASGIYVLTAQASGRVETVTVIAAPARLPSIEDVTGAGRFWGLNFALYGLRSERGTGLGDFDDLGHAASVAAGRGADFVGVNPIHAMGHCNMAAISPYSPSHRGFLNSTYIALDAVPGLETAPDLAGFTDIRNADTVQYAVHKPAHNAALEALFAAFEAKGAPGAQAAFTDFISARGSTLDDFAQFEVLSEMHGPDWRKWPDDRTTPAPRRVRFHMWLQWVANTQLASAQTRARDAGMALGLYLDLAVGPRRDGAESRCEHAAIAQGVSLGAPPDHLSPGGQNWDLAAFSPRKLKALRYAPLRRIIARTMQHAGVIRIDHVLGLNRSFWLPDDGSAGGYIRQPFEALLAVIKIEAERNNCVVIGEDLGLVPDGFRDTMRGHGFYGYSVLQYEKDHEGRFPDPDQSAEQVLSCFATHDTPTLAGFEIGRDIDWWRKLDWIDGDAEADVRARRRGEVAVLQGEGPSFGVQVHDRLARSNASLVVVQLDDVLGCVEAQNLPGTIDQHPNWRRRYDITIDDLAQDARLVSIAALMKAANRGRHRKESYNAE
jgi:4-alpha-glucanotransferase